MRPIAVKDVTAAAMLDMPVTEFRRLVRSGALPPALRIGKHERWMVDQLEAVLKAASTLPSEDFEL